MLVGSFLALPNTTPEDKGQFRKFRNMSGFENLKAAGTGMGSSPLLEPSRPEL